MPVVSPVAHQCHVGASDLAPVEAADPACRSFGQVAPRLLVGQQIDHGRSHFIGIVDDEQVFAVFDVDAFHPLVRRHYRHARGKIIKNLHPRAATLPQRNHRDVAAPQVTGQVVHGTGKHDAGQFSFRRLRAERNDGGRIPRGSEFRQKHPGQFLDGVEIGRV